MVRDGMGSLPHQLKKKKEMEKKHRMRLPIKISRHGYGGPQPPRAALSRQPAGPFGHVTPAWAYQESRIPLGFLCYRGTGTSLG